MSVAGANAGSGTATTRSCPKLAQLARRQLRYFLSPDSRWHPAHSRSARCSRYSRNLRLNLLENHGPSVQFAVTFFEGRSRSFTAGFHRRHPPVQFRLIFGIIGVIQMRNQSRDFEPLFRAQFRNARFDFGETHIVKLNRKFPSATATFTSGKGRWFKKIPA